MAWKTNLRLLTSSPTNIWIEPVLNQNWMVCSISVSAPSAAAPVTASGAGQQPDVAVMARGGRKIIGRNSGESLPNCASPMQATSSSHRLDENKI
jgi:hypothetical protein